MITLVSYAKQNLNLANLKYGKDNLLFITFETHPEIVLSSPLSIINTISCLQVFTAIYATSLLYSEH